MVIVDFANRIKELRNQQGLSQEKFALKIDMDRTYYSSVEAGKRNISIKNIKKIADGFGISLEELFKNMWGIKCLEKTCKAEIIGKQIPVPVEKLVSPNRI